MISDDKKWHYLAVTKLSTIPREITLKHNRNFNCLDCLHLFRTYIKLKGALSDLKQFMVLKSLLKVMGKAFCITYRALFVLRRFRFLF